MSELADKLAGRFIVIDGPDGAGKSTQLELLADWLREQGAEVLQTRDPGGTAIGDRIREILLDRDCREMTVACEIMLYMASRAQLMGEVIAPALQRGRCVLCDRWVSSTVAYQVAGGADERSVLKAYAAALGDVLPGLTVILDSPAELGLERAGRAGGHDRMEAKGLEFHSRVREIFLEQAKENPSRFAVLDATGSIEEVQAGLRNVVQQWRFATQSKRPG